MHIDGWSQRMKRTARIALCGIVLSAITGVGNAAQPLRVSISSPTEAQIYKVGEAVTVTGTASAPQSLVAVKLEYWLLNQLQRRVLATCPNCGATSSSWTDSPTDLPPGYYVLKAYAIDVTGQSSTPAQRTFAAGVQNAPATPVTPPGELPVIGSPVPGGVLPGVGQPVPVSGSAKPGTRVRIFERNLGPLGTVTSDGDGQWAYSVQLPSGTYRIAVAAIDSKGRPGPLSKWLRFTVDATRPNLGIATPDTSVFLPDEPIVLEGTVFDDRRVATVVLEYWLLDRLMLRELARCIACAQQDALWRATPSLPYPGYYHVKVKAYDRAGNPSFTQVTTFIAL